MTYNLAIADAVKIDIADAWKYYHEISPHLSLKLEEDIKTALEKLKTTPLHYLKLNKEFRRISLKSFPYMFVYTTELDEVLILAFFHQLQNPAFLTKRMK